MSHHTEALFVPLNIALLTVSDTRSFETDTSGQLFADRLQGAGHRLAERVLLKDDLYKIRAQVATWIADEPGGADHRRHRLHRARQHA
jgi:molybdenum cofactor biosynthesis protein B